MLKTEVLYKNGVNLIRCPSHVKRLFDHCQWPQHARNAVRLSPFYS